MESKQGRTQIILVCSNGEYVGVLEMLYLLKFCFPLFSDSRTHVILWQAVCWWITVVNGYFLSSLENGPMRCHCMANRLEASPMSMAASHPLVKMVQMLCHSTANHLEVLDHTGIGFTLLLRLSLRPVLASLKFVTVIQSLNPTRNTTDKV